MNHPHATATSPLLFALSSAWLLLLVSTPAFAYQRLIPADEISHTSPAFHDTSTTHFEIIEDRLIPPEAFPVSVVFVGDPVQGLTHDQISEAIEASTKSWSNIACSFAHLEWGGFRDSVEDVADDEIYVDFGDLDPDFIAGTELSESAPQGVSVTLNESSYQWSMTPRPFQDPETTDRPTVDIAAVLTHEFGHVLSLWHTDAHNVATMAGHYLRDGSQKVLSADDKLGACHLYPVQSEECVSDRDCPSGTDCVTGDFGSVCDKPMGRIGDYCGLELQHCPHHCQIDDPATGTGYCSAPCDEDAECPDHFRCLVDEELDKSICTFDPERLPPDDGCAVTGTTTTPPLSWLILFFLIVFRRHYSGHCTPCSISSKV